MSTDNTNNLFMSLAQFVRMPAGMSDIDRRTKLMLNALEAALPCGFTQAVSPPTPPLLRKKYIVPSGASGDWAGHDGEIALYDAANQCWTLFEPNDGQLATMQAPKQSNVVSIQKSKEIKYSRLKETITTRFLFTMVEKWHSTQIKLE